MLLYCINLLFLMFLESENKTNFEEKESLNEERFLSPSFLVAIFHKLLSKEEYFLSKHIDQMIDSSTIKLSQLIQYFHYCRILRSLIILSLFFSLRIWFKLIKYLIISKLNCFQFYWNHMSLINFQIFKTLLVIKLKL